METVNFKDIPNIIKRLEFDGDETDKRLHSDFKIDWHFSKRKKYEQVENDDFKKETERYIVFAWCDVSGFDYWNSQRNDSNYFQVSVFFKQDELTIEEINKLNEDLEEIENHFSKYQMSEEEFMKKLVY